MYGSGVSGETEPTMTTKSPAFITDPAAVKAIQLAGFARSKRNSLTMAIEALDEIGFFGTAAALRVAQGDDAQKLLVVAREELCALMVNIPDRTPRVIAGYETALGAVATAWAWSVMA
jgi:hypothetical protein